MASVSVLILGIVQVVVSVSVTVAVRPGMVIAPGPVGHVVMLEHTEQLGQLGQAQVVVVGDVRALVVLLSHGVVFVVPDAVLVFVCTLARMIATLHANNILANKTHSLSTVVVTDAPTGTFPSSPGPGPPPILTVACSLAKQAQASHSRADLPSYSK